VDSRNYILKKKLVKLLSHLRCRSFWKNGGGRRGGTVGIEKYLPASGIQRNTEEHRGLQRTTVASIFRNQK